MTASIKTREQHCWAHTQCGVADLLAGRGDLYRSRRGRPRRVQPLVYTVRAPNSSETAADYVFFAALLRLAQYFRMRSLTAFLACADIGFRRLGDALPPSIWLDCVDTSPFEVSLADNC